MFNIYINSEAILYFVGNTETKEAGTAWRPTIEEAITDYRTGITAKNHSAFSAPSNYRIFTQVPTLNNFKDKYPELCI